MRAQGPDPGDGKLSGGNPLLLGDRLECLHEGYVVAKVLRGRSDKYTLSQYRSLTSSRKRVSLRRPSVSAKLKSRPSANDIY